MSFLKLEACKECGETRFTVVSVVTNMADIRKGRLEFIVPEAEFCETIASVVCQACGALHSPSDFRITA